MYRYSFVLIAAVAACKRRQLTDCGCTITSIRESGVFISERTKKKPQHGTLLLLSVVFLVTFILFFNIVTHQLVSDDHLSCSSLVLIRKLGTGESSTSAIVHVTGYKTSTHPK